MLEKDILPTAFNNFRRLTGYIMQSVSEAEYERAMKIQMRFPVSLKMNRIDAHILCRVGKKNVGFKAEVKNEIRSMHIIPLLKQFENRKDEWLLISQYIPKPVKKDLKDLGINYLEASGNCNIRQGELMIYINDQGVKAVRKTNTGKIWNTTGLKFLFAVLAEPKLLNEPYRIIADCAGISISNIKGYIDELSTEGYLYHKESNYEFKNQEDLMDRWILEFEKTLLPKITIGKYSFRKSDDSYLDAHQRIEDYYEKNENGREQEIVLGSEAAGNFWITRLRPEKFSVYTDGSKIEVEKVLKIRPDEHGDITLLYMFWNERFNYVVNKYRNKNDDHFLPQYVHPLLAYAELIISGDSRNKEIAERIKDMYLL